MAELRAELDVLRRSKEDLEMNRGEALANSDKKYQVRNRRGEREREGGEGRGEEREDERRWNILKDMCGHVCVTIVLSSYPDPQLLY